MAILDESIAWWKGGSDVAPHSPDQITEAIAFFENLTEIYSGSMSFIGPIPNEQLEKARQRWLEWHRANGAELTLDDTGAVVRGFEKRPEGR